MHILTAVHRYLPAATGSEVYAARTSEELVQRGHRVSVCCTNEVNAAEGSYAPAGTTTVNGVTVHRFADAGFYGLPAIEIAAPLRRLAGRLGLHTLWGSLNDAGGARVVREMLRHDADLIHAVPVPHVEIASSVVLKRLREIPIAATPFYHYALPAFTVHDRHWGPVLAQFDVVVASTEAESAYLGRIGVPPERIRRLGVGVEFDAIHGSDAGPWRQELGIPGDAFCVLAASANLASEEKGIPYLLKAAQRLPALHFVFAGGSTAQWAALARQHGVSRNCHYAGFVSGLRKYQLYNACDAFALPSIADAAGIVYLEAMSAGKPVVLSDLASMVEMGRGAGLNVPFANVDAIVAALTRLRDEESLYRELSLKAVQVAREHAWPAIAARLEAVFQDTVRNHDAAAARPSRAAGGT